MHWCSHFPEPLFSARTVLFFELLVDWYKFLFNICWLHLTQMSAGDKSYVTHSFSKSTDLSSDRRDLCLKLLFSSSLKIPLYVSDLFQFVCIQLCMYQIHLESRKGQDSFHAFVVFSGLSAQPCKRQQMSFIWDLFRNQWLCFRSLLYSVLLTVRTTLTAAWTIRVV